MINTVMQKSAQKRLRRFLAVKEVVMIMLVAVSLGLLVVEHVVAFSESQLLLINIFEVSVSVLFLLEFWFELHYAKNRRQYWRHNWYFLFAGIPLSLQAFEALHGIRALRLLKLLKIFAHMRYEHNTRLFER